jgi:hypothetical protein
MESDSNKPTSHGSEETPPSDVKQETGPEKSDSKAVLANTKEGPTLKIKH